MAAGSVRIEALALMLGAVLFRTTVVLTVIALSLVAITVADWFAQSLWR